MDHYTLDFPQVDRADAARCGGKGANLAEMSRIEGIGVPPGFCVTAAAFRRVVGSSPSLSEQIGALADLDPEDASAIASSSADVRRIVAGLPIPDDVAREITVAFDRLGRPAAYAVRSSATTEDSPSASFAGQHDTYLNLQDPGRLLHHVALCWASLFSARACTYRLRNGHDHRRAEMAVVVQEMVAPLAAGIVFTADPVSSDRRAVVIEAAFGLGSALVDGLVNADVFRVRDGALADRTIARKPIAFLPAAGGGTVEAVVEPEGQDAATLTDEQAVQLAQLARRLEAHFGRPQDIEWCLVDDDFHFVQARPITTLFPIPETGEDGDHVFISVGHQQMMTDPIKPLGLSVWQMTAFRPMYHAGGRLFVDVAPDLASPATRDLLVEGMGRSDPLIGGALRILVDRGDLVPASSEGAPEPPARPRPGSPIDADPEIVTALIGAREESIAALERDIAGRSGEALLDFVAADIDELKRLLFDPLSHQAVMAGMEATWWLNEHLEAWLGEKNAADVLSQSAPGNVTSEMGLALLDVADSIRSHPEVVTFLEQVDDDDFLEEMGGLDGGADARTAIVEYLDRYGMRCTGEIDITRPRWAERPKALVPLILGNIANFGPGSGRRLFEDGRLAAEAKATEVLQRARDLQGGSAKAAETEQAIDRLRTFIGYREYPKYHLVSRYFAYKKALHREAERLVADDVIERSDDIFHLSFEELREVVRTNLADRRLIAQRREEHRANHALHPPRVLTSDGEVVVGSYESRNVPPGALVGLPVSAGVVEGRARVIHDLDGAVLAPGDILVTAFTDPSWTPAFVAIAGLVTEVGGQMTHGSVIAREYGLPAVVGVERATGTIRDGQRIRVHGTDGYVELLP